ncbi:MAG: hypothetical protein ACRC1Z_26835 [Waterburya sp.]
MHPITIIRAQPYINTAKPCRGVSPSEVLRKRETPLRLINMANRTHNQSTANHPTINITVTIPRSINDKPCINTAQPCKGGSRTAPTINQRRTDPTRLIDLVNRPHAQSTANHPTINQHHKTIKTNEI